MRLGAHLCLLVLLGGVVGELHAAQLRISTLNIRWYGSKPAEPRDPHLRAALSDELRRSDVIMFQEIVDIERFKKNVIRGRMRCLSYDHPNAGHQHVVLCHKNKYKFVREVDDDNFTIEAVAAYQNARPALYGVLKRSGGAGVAHIVGVHLKAFPDATSKRLHQAQAIARRLSEFEDDLPIVILGDFNTFKAEKTKYEENDNTLISQIFNKHRLSLYEVPNKKYTYRTNRYRNVFDRLWVSRSFQVSQALEVQGPCPEGSKEAVKSYNTKVSDHCLVSVGLSQGRSRHDEGFDLWLTADPVFGWTF